MINIFICAGPISPICLNTSSISIMPTANPKSAKVLLYVRALRMHAEVDNEEGGRD